MRSCTEVPLLTKGFSGSAEEPQLGCSSEKHHATDCSRRSALDCSAAPQPDSLPCRRCFREFEDVRRPVDIWPRADRQFRVSFRSVSGVPQFPVHGPSGPSHAAKPTDKLKHASVPEARQQRLCRVERLGFRVEGLRFRVYGLGVRCKGSGFRVYK